MFAGRAWLDEVGLMPEDYFLYFEEVDWCLRRGDLPLAWVPDAAVHHRIGGSIGSQGWKLDARPSELASYWMFRNRIRFVRRWFPLSLPGDLSLLALQERPAPSAAATSARRAMMGLPKG